MTEDDHFHYRYLCQICHGVHKLGHGCEAKVNNIDQNTQEIIKSIRK